MKKIFFIFIVVFVNISAVQPDKHYFILSDFDFAFAKENQKSPAITWPQDDGSQFASFNEWSCYATNEISIGLARVVYDEVEKCVPTIEASYQDKIINFDLDPDVTWSCDEILDSWRELVQDQESICIYGSITSQMNDSNILGYLNRFKTARGMWIKDDGLEEMISPHQPLEFQENDLFYF